MMEAVIVAKVWSSSKYLPVPLQYSLRRISCDFQEVAIAEYEQYQRMDTPSDAVIVAIEEQRFCCCRSTKRKKRCVLVLIVFTAKDSTRTEVR